ncbi:MAG: hypothetical protein IJ165_01150 [Proteobacteria bacterium]|nr:hypothetical protein [Pseudomonadota bacterium]
MLRGTEILFGCIIGVFGYGCEDPDMIVLMGSGEGKGEVEPCSGDKCDVSPQGACEIKKCPDNTKCFVSSDGKTAICRELCNNNMEGRYRCNGDVQEMCNGEVWVEQIKKVGQVCSEIDAAAYIIPNCELDIKNNEISEDSTFCKNNMMHASNNKYSFNKNAVLKCRDGRYVISQECNDSNKSKCAMFKDVNLNKIEAQCVDYNSCEIDGLMRCSENDGNRNKRTQCDGATWNRKSCEDNSICAYTVDGVACIKKGICEEFEYKCDEKLNKIMYCEEDGWKEFADCGSVNAHCKEENGAYYCKSWSDK